MNRCVKIVKKLAPAIKDCCFIFILVQLIIDILKLYRLAVIVICHTTYPVWEHPLKWNAVLGGFLLFILLVCSLYCCLDLFSFGAG